MQVAIAGSPVTYQPDDDQLTAVNIELSGTADDIGFSQIPVPDPSASLSVVTGRALVVTEVDTTVLDGFIVDFDRDRGPQPSGTNIVKTISVEDPNAVLTGFRVNRIRPREMDWHRVLAFYLLDAGEKFETMDTTWVLQTNGVRMGRKHYRDHGGWSELISDLYETTTKVLFVHDKAGGGRCLHYHLRSEGHTCGLSISDDPSAVDGVTVFAPGNPSRTRTGIDIVNDVRALDSKGHEVFVSDSASQTAHDADGRLHEAFATFETDDLEDLENKARAFLATNKEDADTHYVTVGPLDGTALSKIRVGDLITVTSTVLDLSASARRIAHVTLTVFTGKDGPPGPGLWDARLELANPAGVAGGGGGSNPGPGTNPPATPSSPTPSGIAAQATLAIGTDAGVNTDATWLYPGGSPRGRIVRGRRYMLRLEVIYNRQILCLGCVPQKWWDRTWVGFTGYVTAASNNPTPAIDITAWVDPTGVIDNNLDPGNTSTPGEIYPDGQLIGTGSSFVSQWMTYDDDDVDIDLVITGSIASGSDGADTVARLTLYEQTADGAPVVPGDGSDPAAGQQIGPEMGPPGDGILPGPTGTTTGRTAYSYLPGSLRVIVSGLDWTPDIVTANPETGDYTLAVPPPLGSQVWRYYQRGTTVSGGTDGSGGATPPVVDPGPATSPELPDTPVDDASDAAAGALQALIDAASDGDVVSVPRARYKEAVTVDKSITLLMNGSTIDAEGSRSMWITIAAHNVHIKDLLCIDAAPDTPGAEKTPQLGSLSCNGWNNLTLENVHLRTGRDMGLYLQHSSNTRLIAFSSNENPRAGASIGNVPNLRIQDSQFNDNLTDATYSPLWEGGGYKIGGSGSTNILIERTECSGNAGVGHWIDEHPSNVTYRDCWGHHNEYSAFMFEISTGGTLIRPRTWENGWGDARGDDPGSGDWGWGAGILISSAGTVHVEDYISAWDSAGITRINQGDRSNRESTVRLTGSGGYVAADDDRRVSSWHQDGSGNQILTTDPSNHEEDLTWYCDSGEIFSWDGDLSAAAFSATRGGNGLTEINLAAMQAILDAADVGGVAGVGIPNTPEAH